MSMTCFGDGRGEIPRRSIDARVSRSGEGGCGFSIQTSIRIPSCIPKTERKNLLTRANQMVYYPMKYPPGPLTPFLPSLPQTALSSSDLPPRAIHIAISLSDGASVPCALLNSLGSLFPNAFLSFQSFAASFCKTPGAGYPLPTQPEPKTFTFRYPFQNQHLQKCVKTKDFNSLQK
jgi:hypothetical protein